jgi:hypothetical protein
MESAELQTAPPERESGVTQKAVVAFDHASDQSVARFDQFFGGASGELQNRSAARLLRSPSLSHSANGSVRSIAFKRAQQSHGNRFAQRRASTTSSEFAAHNAIPSETTGEPIEARTRELMEFQLGTDFRDVRVHADAIAAHSADALQADAYCAGRDIYFAAGKYAPLTSEGRRLIAHELTHVVQQESGSASSPRAVSHPDDASEREASAVGEGVRVISPTVPSACLMRQAAGSGGLRQDNPALATQPPSPHNIEQVATPTSTPLASGPVAPPPAQNGPSVGQLPLGEVEIPLGTLTLFDHDTLIDKDWNRDLGKVELYGLGSLSIPGVTDLKAELGLFAVARARANFLVDYGPGQLRDLKVGMSKRQLYLLGATALTGSSLAAALVAYRGKYTASAQLYVPAHINLGFGIAGELRAGASVGKEIIYLETGVGADATVDLPIKFDEKIFMFWDNGHLHLERRFQLNPTLSLEFQLNAFIKAHLFNKFKWEKRWNLTKTPIDKWPIRILLELHGDPDEPAKLGTANIAMLKRGKNVKMKIEEGDLEPSDLFKKVFKSSKGEKDQVTQKGEERPAGKGGHKAPTGDENDPILMIWAKPKFRYHNPIWLDTPNQPGREPFYRDTPKQLPNKRTIGIDKKYLKEAGSVFPKGKPENRQGEEDKFVKDLEEYGYEGFSDGGYSPDHVLDLYWGGPDNYSNLWPLDRETNAAAGLYHSSRQEVEFNLPDDPPEAAPRKQKLNYEEPPRRGEEYFRGRYFRIKQVADAKGL